MDTSLVMKKQSVEVLRQFAVVLSCMAVLQAQAAGCMGMQFHAHRGAPDVPENSLGSVKAALAGEWDGAEMDIQRLRDGAWVLHHDLKLGRTTSLQGRSTGDLDSQAWREVRLKDRQGRVVSERAAFLSDVLGLPGQGKVLNVEIKQLGLDCQAVAQAAQQLAQGRPDGQWFLTSIDRRTLACARRADPRGYLGLIVLDPQALAKENGGRVAQAVAARTTSPVIDRPWMQRLQQEVGGTVGLHVDMATLEANPRLLPEAQSMGIPVFTYHLGADREHAQALARHAKISGWWPSGVIINGTPSAFCDVLAKP
ncbi:MAG: glycerophosphodiester phosphodiesterase [Burkholderiaceae bacterium]|nr:MAG: glycerophosphodiester phosphodiesterase [Burkholderiaceae bacterium]